MDDEQPPAIPANESPAKLAFLDAVPDRFERFGAAAWEAVAKFAHRRTLRTRGTNMIHAAASHRQPINAEFGETRMAQKSVVRPVRSAVWARCWASITRPIFFDVHLPSILSEPVYDDLSRVSGLTIMRGDQSNVRRDLHAFAWNSSPRPIWHHQCENQWSAYVRLMIILMGALLFSLLVPECQGQGNKEPSKDEQPPIAGVSIAQELGTLEKIGAANEILQFSQEEGTLSSNIPLNYQEANTIRNQIGQAIRNYGGHSSVSGNNQYECHLQSPDLIGMIKRQNEAQLKLIETTGQRRRIEVTEDDTGLRISISSGEDYFLFFHDRRDEGLIVQESDADFMFNGQFTDFNDFCLKNTNYCRQRFFPLLQRFGIRMPATAYDSKIKDLIASLLVSDSASAEKILSEFGTPLLSDIYSERVAAAETLAKRYTSLKPAILQLILDPNQPAELRHRLLEVISSEDEKLEAHLKQIVMPQDLLNNIGFLVWLLKEVEESKVSAALSTSPTEQAANSSDESTRDREQESDREESSPPATDGSSNPTNQDGLGDPSPPAPAVVAAVRIRLAMLTDRSTETSLEEWQKIAFGDEDRRVQSEPVALTPDLFTAVGGLSEIEGRLGELLQLSEDGNRLSLDRQHWVKTFDGQTPRQHFDAVRTLLEERSLPKQWLTEPTTFKLDEDVHGLVLLERIRPDVREPATAVNRQHYGQATGTPTNLSEIRGEHVSIALDMGVSPVSLGESVCRFALDEHGHQQRSIKIIDRPNGSFSITVRSELTAQYFRLLVSENGRTTVRQFVGDTTSEVTSDSFSEFKHEHGELLEASLHNLLRVFGSEIGSSSQ